MSFGYRDKFATAHKDAPNAADLELDEAPLPFQRGDSIDLRADASSPADDTATAAPAPAAPAAGDEDATSTGEGVSPA